MQLEQLQQTWHALDEKLSHSLKLDRELLRLTVVQSTRRRVNRLAFWPTLDLVFAVTVILFAQSVLRKHWLAWQLVLPAGVLHLAALLLLITSIRQLVLVFEIDWSGAVQGIQSSLSRLHLAKIQQFKWIILLAPLVGFCALIVTLQWFLDRQQNPPIIIDKLNMAWVAVNYTFGLLFIPFGYVLIRFLAKRFGSQSWWQTALTEISGTTIKSARAELNHWSNLDPAFGDPPPVNSNQEPAT